MDGGVDLVADGIGVAGAVDARRNFEQGGVDFIGSFGGKRSGSAVRHHQLLVEIGRGGEGQIGQGFERGRVPGGIGVGGSLIGNLDDGQGGGGPIHVRGARGLLRGLLRDFRHKYAALPLAPGLIHQLADVPRLDIPTTRMVVYSGR